jgi:hypothetical protein
MQLNASLFSLNASCGFVLKPPPRPLPNVPLPGERLPSWPPEALDPPSRLRLVVLSGEKERVWAVSCARPSRLPFHSPAGRAIALVATRGTRPTLATAAGGAFR